MKKIGITGATSGIGLEIKKQLEKRGCFVENFSRTNGFNLLAKEGVADLTKKVREERLDTLFLNSGMHESGLIGSYDRKQIHDITNLNYLANAEIINSLWDLIEASELKIVITLSTAAYINGASESVYSTSKKAMKEFAIAANTELLYKGSKNNLFLFSPPFVAGTGMTSTTNTPTLELVTIISDLLSSLERGEIFYVPNYEKVYKRVFANYKESPIEQGISSIEYRKSKGRWDYE